MTDNITWKEQPIIKRLDGSFIVRHNGRGYHVVSKERDPRNLYDINEVAAFYDSLPDDDPRKLVEQPLPSPTLEELKARKKREIKNAVQIAINGGMTYEGKPVKTDKDTRDRIIDIALQAIIDPSFSCNHPIEGIKNFNNGQIRKLKTALMEHEQGCYDREALLIEQIDAAKTTEELEAIEYEVN